MAPSVALASLLDLLEHRAFDVAHVGRGARDHNQHRRGGFVLTGMLEWWWRLGGAVVRWRGGVVEWCCGAAVELCFVLGVDVLCVRVNTCAVFRRMCVRVCVSVVLRGRAS